MDKQVKLAAVETAATVVLVRDGAPGLQVVMLERVQSSGAFAGAWAFPGGKVDPSDYPTTAEQSSAASDSVGERRDVAARTAAIRELAEETGQQLAAEKLLHFSDWLPMHGIPRRFQTRFFVAEAATDVVRINSAEHLRSGWFTPTEVLERHANAEMVLVTPTWVTVHQLCAFGSVAALMEQARRLPAFDYKSYLVETAARTMAVWAGDEMYPGDDAADGAAGNGADEVADSGPATALTGVRHRLYLGELPWVFERTEAQ